MTNKNLGRGLSTFLGETESQTTKNSIEHINVNSIEANPFQPRHDFDEEQLNSLAESIKSKGVLEPILVKKLEEGSYQLIAGERRLRASKIAQQSEIPAIILDISKKEQLEIAILENIQREDLNPIDEAESYRRLMDEFQYTQEDLSKILGKSRSHFYQESCNDRCHVANMLRLLNLPDNVKNLLKSGQLSFGHARALISSENPEKLARIVMDQSLSVRETEDMIRQRKHVSGIADAVAAVTPEVYNISAQLTSLLNLPSKVKLRKNGGVIEIEFTDFEKLDRLISKLNKLKDIENSEG